MFCGARPLQAAPAEYELKGAFIAQMTEFINVRPQAGRLVLCVLGLNPFPPHVPRAQGERAVDIVLLNADSGLGHCSMVFVSASAARHVDRVVALARGLGVLTIGDSEGFARRGLMVNFYLSGDKVRFEINHEAARAGGLSISSRLLALARIVDSATPW